MKAWTGSQSLTLRPTSELLLLLLFTVMVSHFPSNSLASPYQPFCKLNNTWILTGNKLQIGFESLWAFSVIVVEEASERLKFSDRAPPRPPLPGGGMAPPRPPPPETDDEDDMFMHAPQPNQPIMVCSIFTPSSRNNPNFHKKSIILNGSIKK